jgi:hypothetical protein
LHGRVAKLADARDLKSLGFTTVRVRFPSRLLNDRNNKRLPLSSDSIRAAIAPLRARLLDHPVYADIRSPAALRTFMEFHVFAVWDFMSLLKTLQRQICCVTVPWLPPPDRASARQINEIVLGEETDSDGRGGHAGHFDLYHRSMVDFGASTAKIDRLLAVLATDAEQSENPTIRVERGLAAAEVDDGVRQFVAYTFATIESGDACRVASAFTFGREDLLPAVFQKIVDRIHEQTGGGLVEFQYYLKRHIDLDGGEHGPMATRLVESLCGDDPAKWDAARDAAVGSLQARLALWDAIHAAVA